MPHRFPASRGGRAGFTLPELLTVMVVMGLLAYVAVPRLDAFRYKMDAAARGTAAALVSAQRLAVKQQHDVVVAFDTVGRRLRIHQDRDNDGQVGVGESVRSVVLDDGVLFGLGSAPALNQAAAPLTFTERQDGLPAVRFIRNGSASEEGSFYLTSARATRDGQYATDARLVRVARATGRVTWLEYDDPSWVESY